MGSSIPKQADLGSTRWVAEGEPGSKLENRAAACSLLPFLSLISYLTSCLGLPEIWTETCKPNELLYTRPGFSPRRHR